MMSTNALPKRPCPPSGPTPPASLLTARAAAVLAGLALLTAAGCGDRREGKEKFKKVFAKPEKIDFSQVKVDKPPPPKAEPKAVANTWAAKTKTLVAEIQVDLKRCRSEFMMPFQFNKMRRRDVTWVSLSEMDSVCREGTKKKRGAYKRLLWMSKEHVGKHPALDRYIALGVDLSEHYRTLSLMAKKVGAPKIGKITETAKSARDRILAAGIAMDTAARVIAAWPDDLKPSDDPSMVAKPTDIDTWKKELADRYDFFMLGTPAAYQRFANKSWQYPNMIKYKSYRLWPAIPMRLLQQDRARLGSVTGLTDKTRAAVTAYFDSIDGVLVAWRNSQSRYVEGRKKDTWSDKDPFEKPLLKAVKAWRKQREKVLGKLPATAG